MIIKEKAVQDDMVENFPSKILKWVASLKPKTTYNEYRGSECISKDGF